MEKANILPQFTFMKYIWIWCISRFSFTKFLIENCKNPDHGDGHGKSQIRSQKVMGKIVSDLVEPGHRDQKGRLSHFFRLKHLSRSFLLCLVDDLKWWMKGQKKAEMCCHDFSSTGRPGSAFILVKHSEIIATVYINNAVHNTSLS